VKGGEAAGREAASFGRQLESAVKGAEPSRKIAERLRQAKAGHD
jgi:hypothetical protein